MKNIIAISMIIMVIGGCATSKTNISRNPNALPQNVSRIALMPSGGSLADAVGIELLNYGYDVIDTSTVTGYMVRYNLNEMELALPQNISRLSQDGIDTLLIVKGAAGYDGRPENASARLVSTSDGKLIAGVTWQNGKGGAMGSPADGVMRSNLSQAASKIAEGLAGALSE